MICRLKRRGIKVILTVHEILPHKSFFGGHIDKKIINKMYDIADKLLVHTPSLKKEVVELFYQPSEKIEVIHHPYFNLPKSSIDRTTLKIKYKLPEDKKIILFFGTIRENKGLEILLDAMKHLKSEYFLLITGERGGVSEKPAGYYKELIIKNDLVNAVKWVEKYITNEEAANVFKVVDAVILPYKKSFHAQSGVLNLAINYEKPCVVSDVGGIGETVRRYELGIVVEPENVDALKHGIKTLFEEKKEFNFEKYKRENSWENYCEKLITVYKNILKIK